MNGTLILFIKQGNEINDPIVSTTQSSLCQCRRARQGDTMPAVCRDSDGCLSVTDEAGYMCDPVTQTADGDRRCQIVSARVSNADEV